MAGTLVHEAPTILLATVLALQGSAFLVVGYLNGRRAVAQEDGLALLAFSIWWFAAGAALVLGAALEFVDVLWRADLALHLTETSVVIMLGCLALFCLSYYFLYLFTGPSRLWVPLAAFYALAMVGLIYLVHYQRPIGLEEELGRVEITYANELPVFSTVRQMIVLLIVPATVGLIAYLLLVRRVPTALHKLRIVLTAAVIAVLFVTAVTVRVLDVQVTLGLRLALRTLGALFAGLLLLSYRPPEPLRARLGVPHA